MIIFMEIKFYINVLNYMEFMNYIKILYLFISCLKQNMVTLVI